MTSPRLPSPIVGQMSRDFMRLILADSKISHVDLKNELSKTPAGRWCLRHGFGSVHVFKKVLDAFRKSHLVQKVGRDFVVSPVGMKTFEMDMNRIYNARIDYIEEITGREFEFSSLQ